MSTWLVVLTVVAALGSAAMAGVFFAFSAFVMAGLARLPAAQGVAAMQSINVTAVRPALMTALFGTAAVSVVLSVSALVAWGDPHAAPLLVGGLSYVLGTILVTIARNVPLNNSLAGIEASTAQADNEWTGYLTSWTAWNHVRAVAALVAAAAFILVLVD